MTAGSRRSRWALILCGALVAGQVLFVSVSPSTTSPGACVQLQAWAQPYAGASPTLDEVARFDRPHRRAIFGAVAPAVRAALWQEQLRRFDARTDLTPAQHALIAEGRALLTPAMYSQAAATPDAVQLFWARAGQAFTAPADRRAWVDLGSLAASTPAVARASMWETLSAPFHAQAALADCECNVGTAAADCGSGVCNLGGCTITARGCGVAGTSTCNGTCG